MTVFQKSLGAILQAHVHCFQCKSCNWIARLNFVLSVFKREIVMTCYIQAPPGKLIRVQIKDSVLACEQALLFGQAKRPSRLCRSLVRSRETRFTRPNRRACSQANSVQQWRIHGEGRGGGPDPPGESHMKEMRMLVKNLELNPLRRPIRV